RSFGSVLVTGGVSMSGFSAEMSRPSLSGAGAGAAVFFPKILESNVAILDDPLQCRSLRVGNSNSYLLAGRDVPCDVDFVVCSGSAEVVLFHEHFGRCANQFRSLLQGNPVEQLEALSVTLFDQLLRQTFQACRRRAFARRVLENEAPIEAGFFDQRKREAEIGFGLPRETHDDVRAQRHARHRLRIFSISDTYCSRV